MDDRHLFRGKCVEDGEWVYGNYVFHDFCKDIEQTTRHVICQNHDKRATRCHSVDPATIGQCTGLKDKSGTLIFEHDILEYAIDNKSDKLTLKWCDKSLAYRVYDCLDEEYHGEIFVITNAVFGDCLVVGNIHDTQEGAQ